jgi:hypothetical protein
MPLFINLGIAIVLAGIAMMLGVPEFYTHPENYLGAALRGWMIWTYWSAHIWVPFMLLILGAMEIFKRYRQRV